MADPIDRRFSIHDVTVQALPPSSTHPKKRFGHALKGRPSTGSPGVTHHIPVRQPITVRRRKKWWQW